MTSGARISEVGKRHALLSLRARRLARPRSEGATAASLRCLVCEAAGGLYGVPLTSVARVVPFGRAAAVPTANPALLGVIAHGGAFYHAFDLARLLGEAGGAEGGHMLLLRGITPAAALRVDRVLHAIELVELSADETSQMGASHPAVKSYAKPRVSTEFEQRIVALLDIGQLAPGGDAGQSEGSM